MKVLKWLLALAMLGASGITALPASALTCWNPSELTLDYVDSSGAYLDCYGANNLHAQAQGGASLLQSKVNVAVLSGDLARVWGYDLSRAYVNCMAERQGVGSSPWVQCIRQPRFLQLEAWDN